jgi:hypothetical protein
MGCEFEFGYTAELLLGRAEAAGRGGNSRRGGSGRGGNSRRGGGVVAAWWRRGVLEEFWKNSEDSRKKNKYLVFVGFREFLNCLKFLVSPQMGCKNLLRASQTLDGQHSEAGECVAFSFCNDKY